VNSVNFEQLREKNMELYRKRDQMMQNKRILIVDDEPYNILGLKILMPQASNINILSVIDEAKNGQDAVKKVIAAYNNGEYSYGLIIMDCNMPIMDGFDATDYIRNFLTSRDFQQPKIIACTGHTDDEYIEKAWYHRMDEFLMKPTNIDVLQSILKESIEFIE
jgi:YesN/AraC family two-component response regulator